jgi:hypothetical protein
MLRLPDAPEYRPVKLASSVILLPAVGLDAVTTALPLRTGFFEKITENDNFAPPTFPTSPQ